MNPVFKKMNCEEDGLSINQRLDLVSADKTVEKYMGPEPVPTLDIEMEAIQNELQRKMVEEIQCVVCKQFPFKPLECKSCNKLFCKYCQIHLQKGENPKSFVQTHQQFVDRNGNIINESQSDFNTRSGGKAKGDFMTPEFDVCCPNC
jgi:hypothetical protein